ncbi:MAG: acetolactate synthase small subunit [Gammaproteobacteria bacterium]|nr:acetolactate synthase small subunit [Gammaproteobacteria bacterium]MBQ09016.1 acetolactate synthase small subunit [Gammaproteobacteria bacterium]
MYNSIHHRNFKIVNEMKHTIAILLQNESGALTRVSSMFSTRGFNIDSLSVAPTKDAMISRLTLVTDVSDEQMDQAVKQLYKLIDVIDVLDITPLDHIESELMMVKLRISDDNLNSIKTIFYDYSAEIINEKDDLTIIQMLAEPDRINEFLKSIESLSDLIAIARSGPLSVVKGDISLSL